ncbi:MAG: c-type cytochrome biogenesis protein CcsB [Desulfosarcinaceae bacterium]
MTSSLLLSIVTFVYGAAAFAYLAAWVFKREAPGKFGTGLALAAVLGNLAGILLRWRESYTLGIGHAPLTNLYESLMFFSLTIGLLYLYLERRYKNRVIGAFAMPLAFLAMAYAGLSPGISDRIQPLIPALKSNWLIAHVIACFIGYAAFGIAFGVSIMYFLRQRNGGKASGRLQRLPSDKVLDELTHQLVMFGFLWLSAGIITGAVWANSAWGRYWGWDPKETWSFITWLIYAALLHFRLMRGWRGKRIAVLSVVGFLAVLFSYFGVNLLPGLHSYGAMGL